MKKNLVTVLIAGVIISIIVIIFISLSKSQNMTVIKTGNTKQKVIPIVLGKFQDSDCGMVIDDITYSAEIVAKDGRTWFFHDIGGMAHWLQGKKLKDTAKLWVYAKDVHRYIDAHTAWYSRDDITPMDYGFGAYYKKQPKFIDFDTMFLLMLRGENLTNPLIRKKILKDKVNGYN